MASSAAKTAPQGGGLESRDAVDRIIRGRFACRAFASRAVPRRTITDILEVARFAPSGANIQP
jgi:nitroreductase